MPIFSLKIQGAERVATKFQRMGADALDARPAFRQMVPLLYEIEGKIFDSQGRRGGGSWAQDSDAWLARKLRTGLDPRINHASLALRQSMTERNNPNQRLVISRRSLTLASMLPYAARANSVRPFNKLTKGDTMLMREIIRRHLTRAWRRRKV